MVFRNDPQPGLPGMAAMLRRLPAPLFLALGAFAAMKAVSAPDPWPALAGAIAGGWLLGRLTRRPQ